MQIPTPVSPNPTSTPVADAPLKQTYIPCFQLAGFGIKMRPNPCMPPM